MVGAARLLVCRVVWSTEMFNTPWLWYCTSKRNPVFPKPSRELDKDFVEISVIHMVRVSFLGTRHLRWWSIYEERFAWAQIFWGFSLCTAWWQETKTAYSMAAEKQEEREKGIGNKIHPSVPYPTDVLPATRPCLSVLSPLRSLRSVNLYGGQSIHKGFSPISQKPRICTLMRYGPKLQGMNFEGTFQIQVCPLSLPLGTHWGPVLELPIEVKIHRCSSPFHKMAYCLHPPKPFMSSPQ